MKCRLKMPFSYNLPGAHVLLLAGGPTAQYNTLSSSAQTYKHRFQPNHLYTVGPREDWTQDWCAASLTAIYIYTGIRIMPCF